MQLTLRSLVPFALVACAWASPAATDAAKGDAHLFLCNEGGCSSGCERSNSLQQLTPNACYKRSHAFGFASAYIQSTASLPYTVFASHYSNCTEGVQLEKVDTCYNATFTNGQCCWDFGSYYISYDQ